MNLPTLFILMIAYTREKCFRLEMSKWMCILDGFLIFGVNAEIMIYVRFLWYLHFSMYYVN